MGRHSSPCHARSWRDCFSCPFPDCVREGRVQFIDSPCSPAKIAPKSDEKKRQRELARYYQKKAEKAGV